MILKVKCEIFYIIRKYRNFPQHIARGMLEKLTCLLERWHTMLKNWHAI